MRHSDDRSTASFERWLGAIESATAWSRVDTTDRTEDETGRSDGDATLQDDTRQSRGPSSESDLEQRCDCEPGRAEVRFEHPHGGLLLVRQAGPCAAVAGHAYLYFALPGHITDESELFNPLRDAYQRIVAARDSPGAGGGVATAAGSDDYRRHGALRRSIPEAGGHHGDHRGRHATTPRPTPPRDHDVRG